jgi:2-hydroxy-6-oxonona-2,4-dienedioate hydrolase
MSRMRNSTPLLFPPRGPATAGSPGRDRGYAQQIASSRWDEVDGLRIHARVFAGRPGVETIVLVHGIGVSSRYLVPTAKRLAPDFEALAPDLPGFGRSPAPPRRVGLGGLADVLARWLERLHLASSVVLANSFGCQVVTELAVRDPERVGPLVLVGPTVDPARRRGRHQLFAALRDCAREPLLLVGIAAMDDVGVGMRRLVATARAALDDRIEERLPLVEQPTVVVRGGADGFVSADWAEQVASLLADGRLVVVPGEPHAVHFTRPEAVAGIVRELLAEEGRYAVGDGGRLLEHRHVPARQQLQPRVGNEALPLLGDP